MANPPLYRHAALNAQKTHWLGTILLIRPLSYSVLTLIAVLFATMVVVFMTWGTYTKRSAVVGQLVPETGLVKVYSPQFGIVVDKRVREGQAVKRDEVLFVLSSERYSDEQNSIQASISTQHKQQRQSLQDEIGKTRLQQRDEQQALQSRLDGIKDELERLDVQYQAQQTRVQLSDEALKRYQGLLEKNYISREQTQQKQEDWIEQSTRLESMTREQVRMRRELAARQDELSSLRAKHQNQIAQLERSVSSVSQQLTESEAKRRLVIRAPESGTATAVVANLGTAVEGSRPLVSIVPAGAMLQAYLFAPSRAVGFVREGVPVRLRYQAYPYQKFGQASGRVESVSRTALPAGEIFTMGNPSANSQNNEPYYRITVVLERQSITAYGKQQPLQAGMLLDADIMLERRRLYEWVLEPLFSLTGKF
ncbi:MAG TPA: HlyD family efflux transporter periplasmic adaptor subunit [Methylophilus sp.]|uniref:HlyD family secretion protein n=1 Tax=Methylophilus sp. TaxID=29541 RepID=UPI002BE6942B|nr:HlyD family efflux transporter periplasmic adaptor subunit [Methylophilus sp.]HSH88184.1 HlyD family efflux transporter periplasmic adaptor subunit [Methylophilus sp.]